MKIICVLTEDKHLGFTKWLQPSCVHQNLELIPLFDGSKYVSHRLKDILLLEYIKRCKKNEIIFFTDAFDTMLLSNEAEILEKYQKFNSPLVFSAESNCWPNPDIARRYPPGVQKFELKYLNSGGFIGESDYIKSLIEAYQKNIAIDYSNYSWSNQYLWNQIYLNEQDMIQLDHTGEIFYTISTDVELARRFTAEKSESVKAGWLNTEKERILKRISFKNNRIKDLKTGSSPCHIHFNSPLSKELTQTDFFNELKGWK